jgi:molybdopterin-guanine dinucleotide biosynthesis protein A
VKRDGSEPAAFDAVVLAGGGARRLGGTDKPALEIGGVSLLDRVLTACTEAAATVCVGPPRPVLRPVRWAREDPPGGGPVAALAAGLARAGAGRVLVLAADLPFLDAALVRTLVRAAATADGAVLADADGREQWLAACYQRPALLRGLERLRAERGELAGASLRALTAGLELHRVADPGGLGFDCDTWEDVRHVRRLVEDGRGDQRPARAESEP